MSAPEPISGDLRGTQHDGHAVTAQSTPRVSVVIPTYKRPALLLRCLRAVLAQRLAPHEFEILVIDDGHDDATSAAVRAVAHEHPHHSLVCLRPPRGRGPAVARNCGWRNASAPLVAFTDDDTVPERNWLACGLRAMDSLGFHESLPAGLVALCGRVQVPVNDPPTDHELMTKGLESAEFVTANAFVRRDALERVGGFDKRFTRAWREDSDLQFRLMQSVGPVGRCADATVLHPVRSEPWGICLRQQRNAYFDALLYKKHPRLYRERIHPSPPWNYYLIVTLGLAAPVLAAAGQGRLALWAATAALGLVGAFAWRRLSRTARTPSHVFEMVATSALIPFLSVYWRLAGALKFRVLFL